jgi:type I restriction enzyme S subunit
MRAWQGAIGMSQHRGIISPAYVVQRPRGDSNPRYFHWLFRTPHFAKEAERWSYGITSDMWSLRPEHFKMIYCAVPPREEQDAIVRLLDHVNLQMERAIRAKKKLIALLNEQKQAIIHRAVTRGLDPNVLFKPSGISWLGDVPVDWGIKRLKWVVRLQRGYDLPSEKREPGTVPVVSSGGVIDTHSTSRANGPGVVMGRYGSTDSVFYIEQDFWPHNTALFVTDFQGNEKRWCYYMLRTISKGDYAGKSAVPGVDRKDLYEIVVPVPPRTEQLQVAESLDSRLAELNRATEKTYHEIDLIREYRTRLISDVVTGQLDVREATGNLPAEVEQPSAAADDETEELLEAVADDE